MAMTRQDFAIEFRAALRLLAPFMASILPMAMIFGALAVAAGLSGVEAVAMSGLIYSGAAQFTSLELIASGAALPVIALVTALLSLRLVLYGIALIDYIRPMPGWLKAVLAFLMVDTIFFLVKLRFAEPLSAGRRNAFFLASSLITYTSWVVGTAAGVVLGDRLAVLGRDLGLDFLAYACFAGLLGPYLRLRGAAAAALVAAIGLVAFRDLPYNLGLLLCCALAVTVVMAARRLIGSRA
jgi:4-azaleucine resistance transporter AzlC